MYSFWITGQSKDRISRGFFGKIHPLTDTYNTKIASIRKVTKHGIRIITSVKYDDTVFKETEIFQLFEVLKNNRRILVTSVVS